MSKKSIKDFAFKAINAVQDNIQDNMLSAKAIKGINSYIKTLEENCKAVMPGNTKEDTKVVINELRSLIKTIKKDPNNCLDSINELTDVLRQRLYLLTDQSKKSSDMLEIQIMSKCYERAILACENAGNVIKDI